MYFYSCCSRKWLSYAGNTIKLIPRALLQKKEGGRERTLGVRLVTQSMKTKTHFLHRFMTFESNRSNREETYSFAGYKFALSILVFTFYSGLQIIKT